MMFFFVKQKTAYEMRISDWSSDVWSSDLGGQCAKRCGSAGSPSSLTGLFVKSGLGRGQPTHHSHILDVEFKCGSGPFFDNILEFRIFQDRKSTRLNSSH